MRTPRHNLPVQPTPLIGRDLSVTTAVELLQHDAIRLLSVTGPAGVGKSRLAIAIGSRAARLFEDGVCFVDLAGVEAPPMVLPAIGRALGLREARGVPFLESVQQHLVGRQLLLVLDNFEHVLPAAPIIGELLGPCPYLKILTTSRAPLHLRWEHELPLSPLELPEAGRSPDGDGLAKTPAVALFVERARAVEPGFALTRQNGPAIAELCRHLDGLPLAIELAAARVRILSPRAMLSLLDSGSATASLDLLTAGALDMPPRHQTLRAAIGWSHELLSEEHQALFRRLSVFVGGCTLQMVEAVSAGVSGHDARVSRLRLLDGLATLAENHLLRRDITVDGEPRFRMLATIREFAAEQLDASGETEAARHHHALTMMAIAQETERELGGPREAELIELLEREYDNLRAALDYLTVGGDVEPGLRASRALWRFWSIRGHLADGRAWLSRLLERDRAGGTPSPSRALGLVATGWMALEQDDIPSARAHCEEALGLARASGDTVLLAEILAQLGHAARQQGEFAIAQAHYDESLALRQAIGDPLDIAWALRNVAHVARLRGEHARACALYEQSLSVGGPRAPRSEVAGTLAYLGNALLRQGDIDQAERRFAESLVICREIGHRRRLAYALEGLAGVAAARGTWERALRLAGAATALREAIGLAALELRITPARQGLGPARAAECWAAGRALPLEEVAAEALGEQDTASPAVTASAAGPAVRSDATAQTISHPLTHRELDVVRLIVRGYTNRQIAEALVISEGTAAVHVKHILNKLDLESRAKVAVWAVRLGLAGDPE
jgi:predicted ATPase/DNA-binding CsgD family transcriptional regulator